MSALEGRRGPLTPRAVLRHLSSEPLRRIQARTFGRGSWVSSPIWWVQNCRLGSSKRGEVCDPTDQRATSNLNACSLASVGSLKVASQPITSHATANHRVFPACLLATWASAIPKGKPAGTLFASWYLSLKGSQGRSCSDFPYPTPRNHVSVVPTEEVTRDLCLQTLQLQVLNTSMCEPRKMLDSPKRNQQRIGFRTLSFGAQL